MTCCTYCGDLEKQLTTLRDAVREVMPILYHARFAVVDNGDEMLEMLLDGKDIAAIERLRKEMGE